MYVVIYHFQVKDGREADFRKHWAELTHAVKKQPGSRGARLHAGEHNFFVAYTQWESKKIYEAQGPLPESALRTRNAMLESCLDVKGVQAFDLVEDLLDA